MQECSTGYCQVEGSATSLQGVTTTSTGGAMTTNAVYQPWYPYCPPYNPYSPYRYCHCCGQPLPSYYPTPYWGNGIVYCSTGTTATNTTSSYALNSLVTTNASQKET